MKKDIQILHFCIDEKHNTNVVNRFEEVGVCTNRFVVCGTKPLKFDNPKGLIEVRDLKECVELLPRYEYVVFHCASLINLEIASHLTKSNIASLIVWGPSNFELNRLGKWVYEPLTWKIVSSTRTLKHYLYQLYSVLPKNLRYGFYKAKTGEQHPNYIYEKAYAHFQYIATILPEEFDLMLKSEKYISASPIAFSYGNTKSIMGELYKGKFTLGKNIMVGHSGFLYNNQIDALHLIKQRGFKEKVIVPLSYATDEQNSVYKVAKRLFADQLITPAYMPKNQYIELLTSCNSMVFYNTIQQGMANLHAGLYMGMKIFLNENGILYKNSLKEGFKVFSLQGDFEPSFAIDPLSPNDKAANRETLEKIRGEEVIKKKTLSFINTIIA